jgi:hypothetical protein
MTPTESTADSATHERPISVFDEHAGSADHALSRSTSSAPLDETFARAHRVSCLFGISLCFAHILDVGSRKAENR